MVNLKHQLHANLKAQRAALRLKLSGLSERDARLPRTPTGTNLLGLLKHCACMEAGYFGPVFDRPHQLAMPWEAEGASEEDNLDLYATANESMDDVLAFCQACFDHADAVIEELPLEATGTVSWWPRERRDVTLGQILNHVAVDEARHAGHADILREGIDGLVGLRDEGNNLPGWSSERWGAYVEELRRIAAACARPDLESAQDTETA